MSFPFHFATARLFAPILAGATLAAAGVVHAACAGNVAQLRAMLDDPAFPLQWEETGMSDARPLLVTIDDRGNGLFISFVKTREGLLAEGPAEVCSRAGRLEARFHADGLRLGPAASFMLRTALRSGVGVGLERNAPGRLRIGTIGWRGDFVPGMAVGLRTSFGSF